MLKYNNTNKILRFIRKNKKTIKWELIIRSEISENIFASSLYFFKSFKIFNLLGFKLILQYFLFLKETTSFKNKWSNLFYFWKFQNLTYKVLFVNYKLKKNENKNALWTLNNYSLNLLVFIYNDIWDNLYKFNLLFYKNKLSMQRVLFFLTFNFRSNNQLLISLITKKKRKNKNLMFLTSGFFIKFFEKKKSMKKNKLIKLIMMRYLRKVFLYANVWKLILIIKKIPLNLNELLKIFSQVFLLKIIKKKKEKIIELGTPIFLNFFFLKTKVYCQNKIKKKGRIKRKITKKLIFRNHVID